MFASEYHGGKDIDAGAGYAVPSGDTDQVKNKAHTVAVGPDPGAPASDLDEPLETTAPLANTVAPVLCRPDHGTREDCSWYHGLWQYLRIFKLVSTPHRHAGFFFDSFGSLAREGSYRRVLVSGAADYALLAHVLWAYRKEDAAADITVVDLCETPLFLCKWYAKQASTAIDTHASDILDRQPGEPFDLICTHSFLSQFVRERRKDLISKWRELLRPGGKVVTSTRINLSGSPEPAGFTPGQVQAFGERVFQEATLRRDTLGIDPDEMADHARLYAERSVHYTAATREELVQLFEAGGFTIDRLIMTALRGNVAAGQSGPSTNQSATYAEIVASRV